MRPRPTRVDVYKPESAELAVGTELICDVATRLLCVADDLLHEELVDGCARRIVSQNRVESTQLPTKSWRGHDQQNLRREWRELELQC
jgi:hypothetical protein